MQTVLERCRSGTPPTVPERLCQNRRTVLEQYRSRTVRGVPERDCSGTVWGVLERLPFQNSIEPFWHVASLYKMKIHALHGYRPDILSTLKTHGQAHSRTRAVCALADRFCTPLGCVHVSECPPTERAANRATSKHRGNGEAQGNGTNKHPTNIQKAQPHAGGNCRPRIGCWVRWSLCGWLWRWRLAADCGATLVAGFGAALAADCSAAFAAGFGAAFVNGFGGALEAEWGTAAAGDFALTLFPPLCNAQACEVRYRLAERQDWGEK